MSVVLQILEGAPRALLALGAATLLAACGQKGPLFLPTDAAAAGRATLPESVTETLSPAPSGSALVPTPAASAPPSGIAVPAPRR